jgi:hypothetical protein
VILNALLALEVAIKNVILVESTFSKMIPLALFYAQKQNSKIPLLWNVMTALKVALLVYLNLNLSVYLVYQENSYMKVLALMSAQLAIMEIRKLTDAKSVILFAQIVQVPLSTIVKPVPIILILFISLWTQRSPEIVSQNVPNVSMLIPHPKPVYHVKIHAIIALVLYKMNAQLVIEPYF